jgi:hypothetical protein
MTYNLTSAGGLGFVEPDTKYRPKSLCGRQEHQGQKSRAERLNLLGARTATQRVSRAVREAYLWTV